MSGAICVFFETKILAPIKSQVMQGATPKALAIACAVGTMIALIPILGVTTLLCVFAGLIWKLNQPILQMVNYLLYPVQLLLLPVFLSFGATLTHSEAISFNPSVIAAQFMADPAVFLATYGMAGLHALLVWAVFGPIIGWLVYQLTYRLFSRMRVTP